MKTCKHCGLNFKPTKPRQIYCDRDTCTKLARQQIKRDKAKAKRVEGAKCIYCEADISHRRAGSKTCGVNCRNAVLRQGRNCRHCNKDISHMHLTASFCGEKCRTTFHNSKRANERVMKHCLCCNELFETSVSNYCSTQCRNMKHGEWRECTECKTKFLTKKGGRKVTCSKKCSYERRKRIRRVDKPKSKATVKPKKTKTIRKKVKTKAEQIKAITDALNDRVEPIEVPVFKYEPAPKNLPKEGLAKAIAERNKRRGFTPEDKMKAMQDKWLKKNKVTAIEYEATRYEPYQGKAEPIPTNFVSEIEKQEVKKALVVNEGGNLDYGN